MPNVLMTLQPAAKIGEPASNFTLASLRPALAASYEGESTRVLPREADALIRKLVAWREAAIYHVTRLSPREHQIMDLVLAGEPNKNIAADLGISQRTVENHRASIMRKTGARSLPGLARLALVASWMDARDLSP